MRENRDGEIFPQRQEGREERHAPAQTGTLTSGKGGTVKSRKQAIAIGPSEARKKGKKVPRTKSGK